MGRCFHFSQGWYLVVHLLYTWCILGCTLDTYTCCILGCTHDTYTWLIPGWYLTTTFRRVSHQGPMAPPATGPLSLWPQLCGAETQFCPKSDLTSQTLAQAKIERFGQSLGCFCCFFGLTLEEISHGAEDRTSLWPLKRTAIALRSFWCRLSWS